MKIIKTAMNNCTITKLFLVSVTFYCSYLIRMINFKSSSKIIQQQQQQQQQQIPNTLRPQGLSTCSQSKLLNVDQNIGILDTCELPIYSFNKSLDDTIDNLQKVSLPFLDNYHNPCWYESLSHDNSRIYRIDKQMFPEQAQQSYNVMLPVMEERRKSGHLWRLRCLPLVYVLGVAKCGTTDLWVMLTKHPNIVKGATKEPMFWSSNRWVRDAKLSDFLDLFDQAAEEIRLTTSPRKHNTTLQTYHPKITVDFSVVTLFNFQGTSRRFHDNDPIKGPQHNAAKMIKNLTPKAKIIVLLRNPTERLYSEYVFFNQMPNISTSPEEFHSICAEAVTRMSKCLRKWSARACVYDKEYTAYHKWTRLVAGMYAPFVEDWLEIFPHMKIIRTEDYSKYREDIYGDLLQYLGLDVVIPKAVKSKAFIVNKGPASHDSMLPETQTLLDDFYRPFNKKLALLLKDNRFVFEDS